jgi:hypothetical protein
VIGMQCHDVRVDVTGNVSRGWAWPLCDCPVGWLASDGVRCCSWPGEVVCAESAGRALFEGCACGVHVESGLVPGVRRTLTPAGCRAVSNLTRVAGFVPTRGQGFLA